MTTTYGEAALKSESDKLAAAAPGTRNEATEHAPHSALVNLVSGGVLTKRGAARLEGAAYCYGLIRDDSAESVQATIASGLAAGMARPRSAPEQKQSTKRPQKQGGQDQTRTASRLRIDPMDKVESQSVTWLWGNRLAIGKLTLLAGDPGIGKSQIATDIIARLTTGTKWPDGGMTPEGSVIMLSAEDSASDTIRPRLEAAGADLKRVHILRAAVAEDGTTITFSLQRDLTLLADKLREIGDVVLAVIDPITSYLGQIDSHRTTDVRAALEPLAEWAETLCVAVLGITHPPKAAQSKALNAITGSLAFVAAARLVFIAVEEPETERRLLLPVKNNLGPPAPGIGYRLAQTFVSGNILASHVVWDRGLVTLTANEAVRSNGADRSTLREAKEFLREELANGPRATDDVRKAAAAAGLSWSSVRRAQEELRIKPRKAGLTGGWEWRLPEDAQGSLVQKS